MSAPVTRLQVLRATTAVRVMTIFFKGELVFDTDLEVMFVGNGVTFGGIPFSGEGPPLNIAIFTTNTTLSNVDYAIADSATPLTFTLPDATGYQQAIRVNNSNDGLLTVNTVLSQLINGPRTGPATNIQLRKTNSTVLVPKSGAWYLW